jgi:hypothetical protein
VVLGGSINYKFAKSVNFEDVKVVFYDVFSILETIKKARDTVWTPKHGLGPASEYKGESEFHLLDGAGKPTRIFKLKNSWIKNVSHSDLSYDSSNIKEVTLTISYDWAEEERNGETSDSNGSEPAGKPTGSKASGDHSPGQRSPTGNSATSDQRGPGLKTPINPAKESAEKAKAQKEAKRAKQDAQNRASAAALEALALNPNAFRR